MRIALSVAGSDPTGGAGLQLDLQVFRAFGVHGCGVVTALTVQDTRRVHQVLPVFPSVVLDQLRTLLRDVCPAAVKLGMLASDDVLRAVELGLLELERPQSTTPPLVIDPVLHASSGETLLERRAWPALRALLPRAALVTPNLPEAAALVEGDVSSREGVEDAARRFVSQLGCHAVLIKGGHAEGPADDCLARQERDGVLVRWLPGKRIAGGPVHGTGCALSAAVTAALARGDALEAAIAQARDFVHDAIRRSVEVGGGARLLGLP